MKITKSFFKKSEQRNIVVNKYYYTEPQLDDMVEKNVAFQIYDGSVRLSLEDVDKLEVALDEYSDITTVAILKDGTRVYVEI